MDGDPLTLILTVVVGLNILLMWGLAIATIAMVLADKERAR